MRFGHLRGVTLAIALIGSLGTAQSVKADAFGGVLPKEVLARDLNTGQPYLAPPVPWGHYAKSGLFDHFFSKPCALCGLLHGKGGCQGGKHCGKDGCGHCGKSGKGLFHHGDDACGDPDCCGLAKSGHGRRIKDCGLCKGKGCGLCNSSAFGDPIASEQGAPVKVLVTSPQATPIASSQDCTEPGCKLGKGHHHGGMEMGDPCGSCKGKGCGLCGGLGRMFHKDQGDDCDSCGGMGCGKCGGKGKKCGSCGGKGCSKCGMGLKSKLSGLLHPHRGDIKYFVGPGGPVPLTPGYVPYVVPTRSPRDFLAFPPYTPDGF